MRSIKRNAIISRLLQRELLKSRYGKSVEHAATGEIEWEEIKARVLADYKLIR